METEPGTRPPEAILIQRARKAADLSAEEAAAQVRAAGGRISATYWRDTERGYGGRRGQRVQVRASDRLLAQMARVLAIPPERLESEGGRPDAAEVLREIGRNKAPTPQPPPHRPVDFGGKSEADREALQRFIQPILRTAYQILGVLDRFPADDLPDPSEFPDGEAAVSSIPGELLFPDNPGDASTWDKPRLSLRQKLDVIGQGHRLAAQADERERRRTGLTAAAGHIPATGAVPRLVCVAGRAARASS